MKNLKQKYEVEDHFDNLFSIQNKTQNRRYTNVHERY